GGKRGGTTRTNGWDSQSFLRCRTEGRPPFHLPHTGPLGFRVRPGCRHLGVGVSESENDSLGNGQPQKTIPPRRWRMPSAPKWPQKFGIASPSITPPPTEVGSIRRKSKSVSSRGNASGTEESPICRRSVARAGHGIGA